MTLCRGHCTSSRLLRPKCDDHLAMMSEEVWTPILTYRILMRDSWCLWKSCCWNLCERNTKYSNKFSLVFYYHLHQGILLKRGGSSLNKEWKKKYVTLSSDGILSYHSSVNVSQRVNGALLKHYTVEKTTDSSCWIITTAVWLGRTTCWMSPGKRWTCYEWQSRCLGKDHLVLYRPVASQLDSMDGPKMCQDLKASAEVKES